MTFQDLIRFVYPRKLVQLDLSKTENTVEDTKRLAQRCKALEAQLRQTITKKEHHDIVLEFEDKITGMEKTISGQDRKIADQEKELARARAEIQRNASLGKQVADVGAQFAALAKMMEAQGRSIDSLLFKVSQGTVPAAVHQQSISKAKELEERIGGMVARAEYAALQRSYEEVAKQLGGMVPSSDYEVLKGKVQELEGSVASMVPRERLESSEATVRDLRAKLEGRVPQSTYDELVSKVVQLAEEVTGGEPPLEAESVARGAPTEPTDLSPAERAPPTQLEIPTAVISVVPEDEAQAPSSPADSTEAQEIREVGTALVELKDEALTETIQVLPADAASPEKAPVEEAKSQLATVGAASPPDSDSQESQG